MPLIDPSIGDLIDRLSILKLKIRAGEDRQLDVSHFRTEQTAIMLLLHGIELKTLSVEKLFFVNEALWEVTDAMRNAIQAGNEGEQARLGRVTVHLNDQRAEWIRQINEAHQDFRREKL